MAKKITKRTRKDAYILINYSDGSVGLQQYKPLKRGFFSSRIQKLYRKITIR